MVTLSVAAPVPGPDEPAVRAVYPGRGVNDSVFFVSTPIAPSSSSSGCVVTAVALVPGVVSLPVPLAVRSSAEARSPENSLTLTAFAATRGLVTVIVSWLPRAVLTRAEKTTVRTPEVAEPLVTSASRLYEFPPLSAHETAPADGSIANVTMTVSPTATTVLPCIVTESEVPGIVFPLVPTFWTKAIAARASELAGPASITRARSVRVRTRAPVRPVRLVMPPPPSTPREPHGSAVHFRVSAERGVCFSGHAGGARRRMTHSPRKSRELAPPGGVVSGGRCRFCVRAAGRLERWARRRIRLASFPDPRRPLDTGDAPIARHPFRFAGDAYADHT